MRKLLAAAVTVGLLTLSGAAARADQPAPPTISVNGTGSVRYAPDIAHLSLGVRAESPSAASAAKSVNARALAVINAVRGLGIADADITTSNYTIDYQPPQQSDAGSQTMSVARKPPVAAGTYVATETIDVKASIAKAGAVLDAAVAAGSDETYGISFDTSQRQALYRLALARAVADARSQAEILARAAGVDIGGVLSISAGGGVPTPMVRSASFEMAAPAAPVMGGMGTIDATVSVVFKIK